MRDTQRSPQAAGCGRSAGVAARKVAQSFSSQNRAKQNTATTSGSHGALNRLYENFPALFSHAEGRDGGLRCTTMSYLRGADRSEVQLLPPCPDDYVAAHAPARFINAYAERLEFWDCSKANKKTPHGITHTCFRCWRFRRVCPARAAARSVSGHCARRSEVARKNARSPRRAVQMCR